MDFHICPLIDPSTPEEALSRITSLMEIDTTEPRAMLLRGNDQLGGKHYNQLQGV